MSCETSEEKARWFRERSVYLFRRAAELAKEAAACEEAANAILERERSNASGFARGKDGRLVPGYFKRSKQSVADNG